MRPIHHDGSEPLAPQTTHSVRPHGQKHQALKHDYRKPKSRCLLGISSLCEGGSIYVCSVCQWTTRVQMHNMHDPACIRQQNIQNALTLDYGTQLEAWLHKSSTHSDGSNARSTNGPLRWPAPGQAKETLDTSPAFPHETSCRASTHLQSLWGASSWYLMWSCNNRLLGNLLWP